METKHKPYTQEEYKDALDAVYNFHTRCYETVSDYLKRNGNIEIDPDDHDDWRFDFLEHEQTMQVDSIVNDGGVTLKCTGCEDGQAYGISWDEINHDMVIVEMIMGYVFDHGK